MEGQEPGLPSLFIIPLVQLLVGVLLFIALLNGQRDLIVLTLLVLGVFMGARLWTQTSLSCLTTHFKVDKLKVFPGEKLKLKVTVENAKLLPVWLEIRIPVRSLNQHPPRGDLLTREGSLLWYQRIAFSWDLTAERRGVYRIGPLHLFTGDLFAFFSKRKKTEETFSMVVYPRLVPLKPFSLPRRDFFGVPRAKSPIQDPIYILGTRDYQNGQPAKYIHWKASARHDRLQEKVFESTHQEKVLLVVDVNSFLKHQAEEEFERALEIVASLAVRLDQQGIAVGLATNGSLAGEGVASLPVARNNSQSPAILELLARLQMKPQGEILDVLRRGLSLSWGVSCFYFSHHEDESVQSAREYFKRRRTPVTFLVSRPGVRPAETRSELLHEVYRTDDIRVQETERT